MTDVIQQFTDDASYWIELGDDGQKAADVRIYLATRKNAPVRAFLVFCGAAQKWISSRAGATFRAQIGGANAGLVRLIPDPKGTFKSYLNKSVMHIGLRHVSRWPQEKLTPVACTWVIEQSSGGMIVTLPAGWSAKSAVIEGPISLEPLSSEMLDRDEPTPDQKAMARLKESIALAAGPIPEKRPDPIVAASKRDQSVQAAREVVVQRHIIPTPDAKVESAAVAAKRLHASAAPTNRVPPPTPAPVRGRVVGDAFGDPAPGRSALDQRRAGQGQ